MIKDEQKPMVSRHLRLEPWNREMREKKITEEQIFVQDGILTGPKKSLPGFHETKVSMITF